MSFLLNTNYFVTAPVVTAVTWNPLDKHADISLSPDLRTATKSGATANTGVRGTVSRSSGKYYLEFTCVHGPATHYAGIGTSSATLTGYLGSDVNAVGIDYGNGRVRVNSVTLGFGPTNILDGDVLQLAVDLTAKRIWLKVNSGLWNVDGSANPATGVGGFDISSITSGSYFPMSVITVAGNSNTLRTSASEFTGTIPAGFTSWDGLTVGVPNGWNSADKSPEYTLSNGDRTATHSAVGTMALVRSFNSHNSGKYYYEVLMGSVDLGSTHVGWVLSTVPTTTNVGNTGGVGIFGNSGSVRSEGVSLGNHPDPYTANSTLCLAIDMDNKKVWFRKNGGNWNSAANPAAGTGGYTYTGSGPYYPAMSGITANVSGTIRTLTPQFVYAVPSGFSAWDT